MHDKSISASHAVAALFWAIGLVLASLELFTRFDIGELGVVIAGAGATLNVRTFFCQLAYRERNAFEIGREFERDSHRLQAVD